jgi:hypothetical protein
MHLVLCVISWHMYIKIRRRNNNFFSFMQTSSLKPRRFLLHRLFDRERHLCVLASLFNRLDYLLQFTLIAFFLKSSNARNDQLNKLQKQIDKMIFDGTQYREQKKTRKRNRGGQKKKKYGATQEL